MSFVKDTITGFVGDVTGSTAAAEGAEQAAATQAASAEAAIVEQRAAAERAQGFLTPFAEIGQMGIEQAGFLADPQAQLDFLQNNPLFQLALENANRGTEQRAAARGRSSFGTTLQDLSQNVLLSAQPLIAQQRQDIGNLLNLGTGIAGSQANIETGLGATTSGLLTDIGSATSAGQIARSGETAQTFKNLIDIAGAAGGASAGFSDERLKDNIQFEGKKDGHNWYSWDWNKLAGDILGLFGVDNGVIAQQVIVINPDAVIVDSTGFYKVKYGEL